MLGRLAGILAVCVAACFGQDLAADFQKSVMPVLSARCVGCHSTQLKSGKSLADVAKSSARYANKRVITEGKVTAVCQAMGCWMEIGDSDGQLKLLFRRSDMPDVFAHGAAGPRRIRWRVHALAS